MAQSTEVLLDCNSCEMPDERRQKYLKSLKTSWAQQQLDAFQCAMCFEFCPLVKPVLQLSKFQQLFEMNLESGRSLPSFLQQTDKDTDEKAKTKRKASLADDIPWSSTVIHGAKHVDVDVDVDDE